MLRGKRHCSVNRQEVFGFACSTFATIVSIIFEISQTFENIVTPLIFDEASTIWYVLSPPIIINVLNVFHHIHIEEMRLVATKSIVSIFIIIIESCCLTRVKKDALFMSNASKIYLLIFRSSAVLSLHIISDWLLLRMKSFNVLGVCLSRFAGGSCYLIWGD